MAVYVSARTRPPLVTQSVLGPIPALSAPSESTRHRCSVNSGLGTQFETIHRETRTHPMSFAHAPQYGHSLGNQKSNFEPVVNALTSIVESMTALVNRLDLSQDRSNLDIGMAPCNDSGSSLIGMQQRALSLLKKESIPQFDGEIRSYRVFRKDFMELVGTQVTDTIALRVLRRECVSAGSYEHSLVRSKDKLSEALAALDRHFLDPELVENAVLCDLRSLNPVQDLYDSKGFLRIVEVTSAVEDLKSVDREACLGTAALSCLMSKIPKRLRLEIDRIFVRGQVRETSKKLAILIENLEIHGQAQRTHDARTQAYEAQKKNISRKQKDIEGRSDESNRPKRKHKTCIFHSNSLDHDTRHCRCLLTLGKHEIREKLETNKRCLRCFGGHETATCKVSAACSEKNCLDPSTHCRLLHLYIESSRSTGEDSRNSLRGPAAGDQGLGKSQPGVHVLQVESSSNCPEQDEGPGSTIIPQTYQLDTVKFTASCRSGRKLPRPLQQQAEQGSKFTRLKSSDKISSNEEHELHRKYEHLPWRDPVYRRKTRSTKSWKFRSRVFNPPKKRKQE